MGTEPQLWGQISWYYKSTSRLLNYWLARPLDPLVFVRSGLVCWYCWSLRGKSRNMTLDVYYTFMWMKLCKMHLFSDLFERRYRACLYWLSMYILGEMRIIIVIKPMLDHSARCYDDKTRVIFTFEQCTIKRINDKLQFGRRLNVLIQTNNGTKCSRDLKFWICIVLGQLRWKIQQFPGPSMKTL